MSMETWKPRRFVEEFQKRAGLLIDGKPGPQTQMALEFVPELPPGRIYPAVPELTEQQTPTPIDPADIRPGDVVERVMRMTVARRTSTDLNSTDGYAYSLEDDATWRLVSRPDPDAEAVEAIRSASYNIHHAGERMDPLPGLPEATDLLTKLREQGWDVTRTEKVGYHGKYSVVLDHAKGVATCMNGDPHSEHDWWYTDESGGHMIEERNAGPDDRKWHCPGVTRRQNGQEHA